MCLSVCVFCGAGARTEDRKRPEGLSRTWSWCAERPCCERGAEGPEAGAHLPDAWEETPAVRSGGGGPEQVTPGSLLDVDFRVPRCFPVSSVPSHHSNWWNIVSSEWVKQFPRCVGARLHTCAPSSSVRDGSPRGGAGGGAAQRAASRGSHDRSLKWSLGKFQMFFSTRTLKVRNIFKHLKGT